MSVEMQQEKYLIAMSATKFREWSKDMADKLERFGLTKKINLVHDRVQIVVTRQKQDDDNPDILAFGILSTNNDNANLDIYPNWDVLCSLPENHSAHALAYVRTAGQVLSCESISKARKLFKDNLALSFNEINSQAAPDQGDGK